MFQGSFKRVSAKFQAYFQILVSRVFEGRLKGVSREISVSFKGISKKFKEMLGKFQRYFMEI